jgi:hypothetical protein
MVGVVCESRRRNRYVHLSGDDLNFSALHVKTHESKTVSDRRNEYQPEEIVL